MFRLILLTLCCVAMVMSMEDTAREKRLVLHSDEDVAAAFQTMAAQIHSLNATVQSLASTVQAKDNLVQTHAITIQALQTTAHSRDTTIQSLQTTSQSLLTTIQSLQNTVLSRDSTIESMQTTIESLGSKLSKEHLSSTYIRWGRTDCQPNGTELVYKGFAGGSLYSHEGGAADYICLTQEPLWGYYTNVSTYPARVYGTEYQIHESEGHAMFGQNVYDHDVPCAMCRAPRSTTVMIPGRNKCYPGWTEEYAGYLVSGHYTHISASNYACLDIRPEVVLGDSANDNGHLMYVVEAICGALKCPPYVQYREITCVVCSI